jgi:hypothetical protein
MRKLATMLGLTLAILAMTTTTAAAQGELVEVNDFGNAERTFTGKVTYEYKNQSTGNIYWLAECNVTAEIAVSTQGYVYVHTWESSGVGDGYYRCDWLGWTWDDCQDGGFEGWIVPQGTEWSHGNGYSIYSEAICFNLREVGEQSAGPVSQTINDDATEWTLDRALLWDPSPYSGSDVYVSWDLTSEDPLEITPVE